VLRTAAATLLLRFFHAVEPMLSRLIRWKLIPVIVALAAQVDITRAYHFGARYNVEIEIILPGDMSVRESHDIALELQHKVRQGSGGSVTLSKWLKHHHLMLAKLWVECCPWAKDSTFDWPGARPDRV